jgi:hypothetical protein
MTSHINICRPGYGASCTLCCGSHNYHACIEEIEALFRRRGAILKDYNKEYILRKMAASRSNLTGSYYFIHDEHPLLPPLPALFDDCPRCPFVGFIPDDQIVGCLLYPDGHPSNLQHDCFHNYRGKFFSCRAREILVEDEILYAARLTGNWYHYSVLIHNTDLLRNLMQKCPKPEEMNIEELNVYKLKLEAYITSVRSLHRIHGYF